jgi:tetratricopeptide (TPR) repeat protein
MATLSACAPRTIPAPVITAPKFPSFIIPAVPPSLIASPASVVHDRGWRFLQAGDLRNADRELGLAVRADPAFYPVEAALGYLELARSDPTAAVARFDRALERQPDYVSALVGRGQALLALDRDQDALAAFEAAIAADPSLNDIRLQVEVLRFRAVEANIDAARRAARGGQGDEAVRAYEAAIASSPESAFLYRELAGVERQRGAVDRALEHLRRAAEIDPSDAGTHAQIGMLLEARGDVEGALAAYDASLALESNAATEERREALRARVELSRMPEEYRAIDASPQITRADLAALIGVRLGPALRQTAPSVVVTDVRQSWAESWIMAVVASGVMDPYDNHTFQPGAIVRRVDLAQAVSRLLGLIATPAQLKTWQSTRPEFSDISRGHLAYPAASTAAASGVMRAASDNSFEPSRPVSGADAIQAIERLQQLGNLTRGGSRP